MCSIYTEEKIYAFLFKFRISTFSIISLNVISSLPKIEL